MKKKKQKENNFDKLFLITINKIIIIILVGFLSVILHNLIYKFFNYDEIFFFSIIAFFLPLYILLVVVYTLIKHYKIHFKK